MVKDFIRSLLLAANSLVVVMAGKLMNTASRFLMLHAAENLKSSGESILTLNNKYPPFCCVRSGGIVLSLASEYL